LIAHDGEVLSASELAAFEAALAQALQGVPIAYLLGEREFHGLMLEVTPDVLVPRPDTEVLVDWALALLQGRSGARVVDLGTGSGAIALALKHRHPGAQVLATDASAAALQVARRNALRHGLDIRWQQGSWWQAVGSECFDLAVSNPPYVAGDDPHLQALRHEPRAALTPEGDGLDALRRIVEGAHRHLVPGAWLLLEHGHDQATAVAALLVDHGFVSIRTQSDLAGLPRCTGGQRPV
jgi:release factor glutamine methyltransferase